MREVNRIRAGETNLFRVIPAFPLSLDHQDDHGSNDKTQYHQCFGNRF
jgi:hypothetical protein